jgi:hypothetical protein
VPTIRPSVCAIAGTTPRTAAASNVHAKARNRFLTSGLSLGLVARADRYRSLARAFQPLRLGGRRNGNVTTELPIGKTGKRGKSSGVSLGADRLNTDRRKVRIEQRRGNRHHNRTEDETDEAESRHTAEQRDECDESIH